MVEKQRKLEKKINLDFLPIERNKNVIPLCGEALKGDKRVSESLGGKERTL